MCKCRECREEFTPKKSSAAFCSTSCRKTWNNRRAMRGAILYDLFMTQRYQRGLAKKIGVWAVMCRLAMKWHNEDQSNDRRSWGSAQECINANPWLKATNMGVTLGSSRMPTQQPWSR